MEDQGDEIARFFGEAHPCSYDQGKAEGRVKGKAEGRAEGKANGLAEAVLRIMRHRGLVITPEQREQILACTDIATLDRWLDRAFSVASADELVPRSMESPVERFFRDAHRRLYNRGRAEGHDEGKVEGKAEGKAEVLLRILRRRDLAITAEQLQQILACTDIARLEHWLARALSAASVDELLG